MDKGLSDNDTDVNTVYELFVVKTEHNEHIYNLIQHTIVKILYKVIARA